jgi:hypothetical protein
MYSQTAALNADLWFVSRFRGASGQVHVAVVRFTARRRLHLELGHTRANAIHQVDVPRCAAVAEVLNVVL